MDKSTKKQILHKIYDNSERCIIAPENPFTLDNPDAIVANGNKLYAIFIPTYMENENMDHLLRRLYVSQLSYGYQLITVLMAVDDVSEKMLNNHVINRSFDYKAESFRSFLNIVSQVNPKKCRLDNLSEIRTKQYISYRQNLYLSEGIRKEMNADFSTEEFEKIGNVVSTSWSSGIQIGNRSFWKARTGLFAAVKKQKNSVFKTSFNNLMTFAFMSKFDYDDGGIFPSKVYEDLSILNTDWTMFNKYIVPNSYNQMLSFIGLLPVSISTEEEIKYIYDKFEIIKNHVSSQKN